MKWEKVNLPKFEYATADNFFNTLDHSTKNLPEIEGERPNVWLYIHGPSHEKAITASRKGDLLLPAAEAMASYRIMTSGSFLFYPSEMGSRSNGFLSDHDFRFFSFVSF